MDVQGRVLVLNASDEPLAVTGLRRAVGLVLAGKADVVAAREKLHSVTREIDLPLVVRLRSYVHVPHRRVAKGPSLAGLKARDGEWCAYCTKRPASTIDHVVPRSRGGEHLWENTVACCAKCNNRKGAKTPHEAGLRLGVTPKRPSSQLWLSIALSGFDEAWMPFVEGLGIFAGHGAGKLEPVPGGDLVAVA